LGGGSFLSSTLSFRRGDNTNSFSPESGSVTASFFTPSGVEYTSSFKLFPSYSVSQDTDFMWYESGITSPQISLTFDNGDGVLFGGSGQGSAQATKDVVVTATFTDPISNGTTTVQETYFIISDGIDGADAYTVVLTNESHTVPALNDGTVTSFVGSGTNIIVYKGSTKLAGSLTTPTSGQFSASVSSQVNITATQPYTVSSDEIVYGNHSAMTQDSASIEYTIFLEGTTIQLLKLQSFTKAKAGATGASGTSGVDGAAGAPAKTVQLSATSYIVSYDENSSLISPSTIQLNASSSNFTNGFFFFTGSGLSETVYTDGVGANFDTSSITLPSTYFTEPRTYRVGVAEGNQAEVASDTITIFAVKPGLPGTPGDSAIEYKIVPQNGTQIKNSEGSLELQVVQISGSVLTNISASGDYKLASGSTFGSILTVGGGYTDGADSFN
jgi:hypothetical protein